MRVRRELTPLLLALFALWSMATLIVLLLWAVRDDAFFAGPTAGLVGVDQLRYLAWVREAADHGLVSNEFELGSNDHLYLQPLFLLSGIAFKLGAGVQVAYLLWLPVAIAVLAYGFAAYVRRMIARFPLREAALALALLFVTPVLPLLDWSGSISEDRASDLMIIAGESVPYWQTWGFMSSAIALGLMPLYFLALERLLDRSKRRHARSGVTYAAGAGALGLAVSWLHPWGGLTLMVVTAGLALWGRLARSCLLLVGPAVATAAPLVYHLILAKAEPALGLGQLKTTAVPTRPVLLLIAVLAPLAVPALLGIRRDARAVQERILLLWTPSALLVFLVLDSSAGLGALAGLTLPLGILAVRGWQRLGLPAAVGWLAVGLVTLPGMLYAAQTFRDIVRAEVVPYLLTGDEHAAVRHVARSPSAGHVLATPYLGSAVPALTGRDTWVSYSGFNPAFAARAPEAERLFDGELPLDRARQLTTDAGARFLLADCNGRASLTPILAPLGYRTKRFGCAAVYKRVGQGPARR